ncbi:hypothetical protein DY000_02064197 [Brassica cretica]|uniref:Malectin-like domain-containing protein n=1 Tax=Brassica cretica TaxID=69181 RepID=A0ABQ7AU00_BRACR|nr:hypothetical protein DY000_02064197 [Brassica cretica]
MTVCLGLRLQLVGLDTVKLELEIHLVYSVSHVGFKADRTCFSAKSSKIGLSSLNVVYGSGASHLKFLPINIPTSSYRCFNVVFDYQLFFRTIAMGTKVKLLFGFLHFAERDSPLDDLQASGLKGPIPDAVARLENLTNLIISDMTGINSFPNISSQVIQNLILRNVSMSGPIPSYIWSKPVLRSLDLSFNKLTGVLGINLVPKLTYLTGNMLSGEIKSGVYLNSKSNMYVVSFSLV